MKRPRSVSLQKIILHVLIFSLFSPLVSGAEEIRLGGTGNALGTMRILANEYNKSHLESHVFILDSLGSGGGIRAVSRGAIQIGLSSRPLTDEEKKLGLHATQYAHAPTVFAVSKKNPLRSITIKEIQAIYEGKMTRWPDGTSIRPILRQPNEDNTQQVIGLAPGMKEAIQAAHKRPGMPYAVTDQDAANKMEGVPGSIGVTSLPLILSEKRALRPLALNGISPTGANIRSGRYPMVKYFYYVLPDPPSPAAMTFIGFLNSPKGRSILKRYGHSLP